MNFSRLIKTGGALVFAAIVAVGCSSTQTTGQQIDDGTIVASVKAALASDPNVKSFGIDVDSVEGVVSLRGNVQTAAQKAATERIARSVDGVRGVKNEIHVGEGDSAGTHIDDAGITASIKTAFAADPDVSALAIDVDTRDGVVTLSGRVETSAMRAKAEDIARRTSGVKSVRNELLVGDKS